MKNFELQVTKNILKKCHLWAVEETEKEITTTARMGTKWVKVIIRAYVPNKLSDLIRLEANYKMKVIVDGHVTLDVPLSKNDTKAIVFLIKDAEREMRKERLNKANAFFQENFQP